VFVHDILLDVCSELIVVERLGSLKTSIREGRHEGVAKLGIVVSHRERDVEESNLQNIEKSDKSVPSFVSSALFRPTLLHSMRGSYREGRDLRYRGIVEGIPKYFLS